MKKTDFDATLFYVVSALMHLNAVFAFYFNRNSYHSRLILYVCIVMLSF